MALTHALKQHEWFSAVPSQVLGSVAEMLAISRELRAKIRAEGVMRADGTLNPAVEAFRKYKHTELGYLTAIAEMRRAEHEEPRDLVAEMARAGDEATVEPEASAEPPLNRTTNTLT
jgi:hypothetical protein